MTLVNDLSSFAATIVRLGRGIYPRVTRDRRRDPEHLLELYDFEGCPYCRKVREVLCELDLDYVAYPVAQGSPRRRELTDLGGKMQVPYLVDRNTGTHLYESDEIIDYLNDTYGAGERAGWALLVPAVLDDVDSGLASLARFGSGTRCRAPATRAAPPQPLTLYNMEGSPYCRKVRERLSELDLVYTVRNVPKGSPKRAELVKRGGKMQVPCLIDPNYPDAGEGRGGCALYESDDIVAHLERYYGGSGAEPRRGRRPARRRAGAPA